jgi:Family of unknown function (DUF6941)
LNIDWVIPCRFVEVHDNLATIVGGGIDTFWVPQLPAPVQVFLAVRLTAAPEELESDELHATVNRIRDPRGELISETSGEIGISGQAARPDWLVAVTLAMIVAFQAPEEGAYTIELDVDDASRSLPIHVIIAPPAP